MALSEMILGSNGDNTLAEEFTNIVFNPGERVQHIITKKIGTIGNFVPKRYQSYEVPVTWDDLPSREGPESKILLVRID